MKAKNIFILLMGMMACHSSFAALDEKALALAKEVSEMIVSKENDVERWLGVPSKLEDIAQNIMTSSMHHTGKDGKKIDLTGIDINEEFIEKVFEYISPDFVVLKSSNGFYIIHKKNKKIIRIKQNIGDLTISDLDALVEISAPFNTGKITAKNLSNLVEMNAPYFDIIGPNNFSGFVLENNKSSPFNKNSKVENSSEIELIELFGEEKLTETTNIRSDIIPGINVPKMPLAAWGSGNKFKMRTLLRDTDRDIDICVSITALHRPNDVETTRNSDIIILDHSLTEGEEPMKVDFTRFSECIPNAKLVVHGNGIELVGMTQQLLDNAIINDPRVKEKALINLRNEQQRQAAIEQQREAERVRQMHEEMLSNIGSQEALNYDVLNQYMKGFFEALSNVTSKGDKTIDELFQKMTSMDDKQSEGLLNKNIEKFMGYLNYKLEKAKTDKEKFTIEQTKFGLNMLKHDPAAYGFLRKPFGGVFTDYKTYDPKQKSDVKDYIDSTMLNKAPNMAQLFNFLVAVMENDVKKPLDELKYKIILDRVFKQTPQKKFTTKKEETAWNKIVKECLKLPNKDEGFNSNDTFSGAMALDKSLFEKILAMVEGQKDLPPQPKTCIPFFTKVARPYYEEQKTKPYEDFILPEEMANITTQSQMFNAIKETLFMAARGHIVI